MPNDNSLRDNSFEERGYTICRQFFSEEELCFLEEALKAAEPRYPSTLNKNGLVFREFLYFHSKSLQTFLSSEKIVRFLKPYIGNDFWVRKDQTVTKHPGGGEFPWHQDNAYNSLKDAYFQFWIALTDMNPENGGLRLLPGTHRNGIEPHRLIENHLSWEENIKKEEVAVRIQRGDIALFSSMLLHRSGPNLTDKNRAAYVLEYMSSDHFDPYIHPPYFQVAQHGLSDPKFVRFYKGNLSFKNQLRYAIPRMKRKSWLIETSLKNKVKRLLRKV